MWHKKLILNYFFLVLQFTNAFHMDGVYLNQNKEYLRLQESDSEVLECRFSLDKGQDVEYVLWYHDDHLAMKWHKNELPTSKFLTQFLLYHISINFFFNKQL